MKAIRSLFGFSLIGACLFSTAISLADDTFTELSVYNPETIAPASQAGVSVSGYVLPASRMVKNVHEGWYTLVAEIKSAYAEKRPVNYMGVAKAIMSPNPQRRSLNFAFSLPIFLENLKQIGLLAKTGPEPEYRVIKDPSFLSAQFMPLSKFVGPIQISDKNLNAAFQKVEELIQLASTKKEAFVVNVDNNWESSAVLRMLNSLELLVLNGVSKDKELPAQTAVFSSDLKLKFGILPVKDAEATLTKLHSRLITDFPTALDSELGIRLRDGDSWTSSRATLERLARKKTIANPPAPPPAPEEKLSVSSLPAPASTPDSSPSPYRKYITAKSGLITLGAVGLAAGGAYLYKHSKDKKASPAQPAQ